MSPAGPEPGRGAGPERQGPGAAALLLLYAALFFAPVLAGGQFFFRDASQNHHPFRQYQAARLDEGSLPLWNPLLTFGQPLLANPNAGLLHPTTLLFLLLPFDAAFRWAVLVQFLVAAVGTFLLLRDLRASPPAAALGGLVFAFGGPMASLGNLQNVLASAAWMPAALWLLGRAAVRGGVGWMSSAAAGVAVLLLGGEPLSVASTALLALLLLCTRRSAEAGMPRAAARIGGAMALGIAAAGVQILPALEMVTQSERGAGFAAAEVTRWSLHPLRLVELVAPGWFGDPAALEPALYWGEGFFDSSLPLLLGIYLGGPVLLLAGSALALPPRTALDRSLGIAAGGFLFLALGRHGVLPPLIWDWMPGAGALRYPSKLLLPASFCLALLAARGLDRLVAVSPSDRARRVVLAGGIAAAAAAAGAAGLWASPTLGSRLLHGPMRAGGAPGGPRDEPALAGMRGALGHAALVTGAAAGLLAAAAGGRLRPSRAGWVLVALVATDLYAGNAGLNPTVDPAWYRVEPRFLATIREIAPGGRIFRFPRPRGFGLRAAGASSAASAGFLWDRASLRNATPMEHGLHLAFDRNNDRLHPAASGTVARLLEGALPLEERVRLWRLGGTRFVVAYEPLAHPDLRLVDAVRGESTHPLLLYELTGGPERIRVVGSAVRAGGLEEALDAVRSGRVDPSRTVILPSVPAPAPAGEIGDPPGAVRLLRNAPENIEIDARCASDCWLVLSDSNYPGWRVEVDGVPGRIEPAYLLFRAVRLEAGEHRVVFRYRPASLRAGAALSALAVLAVGALALAGAVRRRRARR